MSKTKQPIIIIGIVLITILGAYWLKSQAGWNISDSFSLSRYFPFKYLTKSDVIKMPKPGIVITESFESRFVNKWPGLWMKEKGKVTREFSLSGRSNTRCLLVKSSSPKSWSCAYGKFIEVQSGDQFGFEGFVKQEGQSTLAGISISAFDKDKKVVKWGYVREKENETGIWSKLNNRFRITDSVAYIKVHLYGRGVGEFRFDDIKVVKG